MDDDELAALEKLGLGPNVPGPQGPACHRVDIVSTCQCCIRCVRLIHDLVCPRPEAAKSTSRRSGQRCQTLQPRLQLGPRLQPRWLGPRLQPRWLGPRLQPRWLGPRLQSKRWQQQKNCGLSRGHTAVQEAEVDAGHNQHQIQASAREWKTQCLACCQPASRLRTCCTSS